MASRESERLLPSGTPTLPTFGWGPLRWDDDAQAALRLEGRLLLRTRRRLASARSAGAARRTPTCSLLELLPNEEAVFNFENVVRVGSVKARGARRSAQRVRSQADALADAEGLLCEDRPPANPPREERCRCVCIDGHDTSNHTHLDAFARRVRAGGHPRVWLGFRVYHPLSHAPCRLNYTPPDEALSPNPPHASYSIQAGAQSARCTGKSARRRGLRRVAVPSMQGCRAEVGTNVLSSHRRARLRCRRGAQAVFPFWGAMILAPRWDVTKKVGSSSIP